MEFTERSVLIDTMLRRHKALLDSREGDDDSDVQALMDTFGLSEDEAASIYRIWIDSMIVEKEAP